MRINGGDIPGVEEPMLVEQLAVVLEVVLDDGEAAHLEPTEALAVPGEFLVFVVDDLHLDAKRRPALLRLDREPLVAWELARVGLHRACRTNRTHFRHAPGMTDGDAVIFLESADHLGRAGGPADADKFERRKRLLLLAQILQEAEPYGRHSGRHRHLFGLEEIV